MALVNELKASLQVSTLPARAKVKGHGIKGGISSIYCSKSTLLPSAAVVVSDRVETA